GPATRAPEAEPAAAPTPSQVKLASELTALGWKAIFEQPFDYPKAVECFSEAFRLDPTLIGALLGRARAYAGMKDLPKAFADCDEAQRRAPRNPDVYMERAAIKLNSGDFHGAIFDSDTALELDRNKVWAYFNRGLAYHRLSDFDRAIADLTEMVRRAP